MFVLPVAIAFIGCSSTSEPTDPDATRDADSGQDANAPDSPDTDALERPDAAPEADADADDADAASDSDLTRDASSALPEVADGALDTEADAEVDADAPLDAEALPDADALDSVDTGPDCAGELQEWCPCEVKGRQCCTTIGMGLLCEPPPPFPPVPVASEYVWRVFYDCGCWPGPPCEDWPLYSLCTTSER